MNVTQRLEVEQAVEQAEREFGQIDILINNAGIVAGKRFLETPPEAMLRVMDVNAISHFWTNRAVLPGMIKRRNGHIVSIASIAGQVGVCGLVDYSASKFAAVSRVSRAVLPPLTNVLKFGINESIRMEMRYNPQTRGRIHTTTVCPFYINTGMFDGVQSRFPLLLPILDQVLADMN